MGDATWLRNIEKWPRTQLSSTFTDICDALQHARVERRYSDVARLLAERELVAQELDRRMPQLPF